MDSKGRNKERNKKKCEALTRKGAPCSAWAIRGSRYCSFHTEALRDRVNQGRREGGIVKKSWDFKEELPEVETYEDAMKLLNKLKRQVYTKKLPPVIANTLLNITAGLTKLIEMKDSLRGGGRIPPKLYDFDHSKLPSPEEREATRKVLASDEGREALETLSRIVAEEAPEEIPETREESPRLPAPRPEIEQSEAIEAEPVQRDGEETAIEAEIEEKVPEEPKEEEKPTVAFTDTEEFWEMLEERQRK